jgi:hypothetical protein
VDLSGVRIGSAHSVDESIGRVHALGANAGGGTGKAVRITDIAVWTFCSCVLKLDYAKCLKYWTRVDFAEIKPTIANTGVAYKFEKVRMAEIATGA